MHCESYTVDDMKKKALKNMQEVLGKNFEPECGLHATLRLIPWQKYCQEAYDQVRIVALNRELDPCGCLGRAALILMVIEKYFPDLMPYVRYAEVQEDLLRSRLLEQWNALYSPRNLPPKNWLEELLAYEDPHAVITVNDMQFDPLFYIMRERGDTQDLFHPKIVKHDPWEGILSSFLVSRSFLCFDDNGERIAVLRAADEVCPGTMLVCQNLIGVLTCGTSDDMQEACEMISEFVEQVQSFRVFLTYHMLTGQVHPLQKDHYDDCLWGLLRETFFGGGVA